MQGNLSINKINPCFQFSKKRKEKKRKEKKRRNKIVNKIKIF
jgi:hypothetical protein